MDKKITKELIEFIKASPTSFHAINTITTQLQESLLFMSELICMITVFILPHLTAILPLLK